MMEIQEPATDPECHSVLGHKTTHPAFGSIGAFRTTGGMYLYDSEFQHNGYVTVRICHS